MTKFLYIDDEREVPNEFTHCSRSFDDALDKIQTEDWDCISFDHDLGSTVISENGLTLMNRLEELVYLKERKAPLVVVHTANGGARTAMELCACKINNKWIQQEQRSESP